MTGLTRAALSAVQPGDEVRLTRNSLPYRVKSIARQNGSWTVTDSNGTAHHYPDGAAVWRTDACPGQTALLDPYALEGAAHV